MHVVDEVDVVDVVVEVDESSDFLQPRIRNNGSETTSIILSNSFFPPQVIVDHYTIKVHSHSSSPKCQEKK